MIENIWELHPYLIRGSPIRYTVIWPLSLFLTKAGLMCGSTGGWNSERHKSTGTVSQCIFQALVSDVDLYSHTNLTTRAHNARRHRESFLHDCTWILCQEPCLHKISTHRWPTVRTQLWVPLKCSRVENSGLRGLQEGQSFKLRAHLADPHILWLPYTYACMNYKQRDGIVSETFEEQNNTWVLDGFRQVMSPDSERALATASHRLVCSKQNVLSLHLVCDSVTPPLSHLRITLSSCNLKCNVQMWMQCQQVKSLAICMEYSLVILHELECNEASSNKKFVFRSKSWNWLQLRKFLTVQTESVNVISIKF